MRESRRVLLALGALLVGVVAVNIAATVFFHSTGGSGLLDLSGGANLFDARPALTPATAHTLLANYGPAGRAQHAVLLLTADLVFPAILAGFGLLALRHATGRRWPLVLPLAYLLSDYTENVLELALLHGYPTEAAGLVRTLAVVTLAKTAIAATMLVTIAVAYLIRRRNRAGGPSLT